MLHEQDNETPRKVATSEEFLVISRYVRLTRPFGLLLPFVLPVQPLADAVYDYTRRNGENKSGNNLHEPHLLPLRRSRQY